MDSSDKMILVGLAAAFIVILVLTVWASVAEHAACAAKGGHILSKSVTGVGIVGDGKMATTFSTTEFCISRDGRILEGGG